MAPKKNKNKRGKTTKNKKKKKSSASLGGLLFKWAFVAALWCFIIVGGVLAWYAAELPQITEKAEFKRQSSITILDRNGDLLIRYGEIKGNNIDVNELPHYLIQAILATEDRRFYDHFGLDLLGLGRAVVVNVKEGRIVQGGSTITQQLAKNLFLSHERTFKRKIQEAMLALWLEQQLTKNEILTAYVNRVYLGSGAYGVDAASKIYFNKSATDITLEEAALLAGLLKAPSRYSPRSNPELARERTAVVLAAMADAGFIRKTDTGKLLADMPEAGMQDGDTTSYRYFTDWVVDGLDTLIGNTGKDLVVQTTLDKNIQQHAAKIILDTLNENGEARNIEQAANIIMGLDGAIVAMVGGKNYTQSQFNRITQAKRQPGSSFKPIVYLTALEQGYTPQSLVLDAPITEGKYKPKNFNDEYAGGEVTLHTALTRSLNTVAVRLIQQIGPENVVKMARQLGIISPLDPYESLALGTSAISPLELNTAYTTIANGGYAAFPYAITHIRDDDGQDYYKRPEKFQTRRMVSANSIKDLKSMMRNVVEEGTGRAARLSVAAAGKTGTSQDSRDAWFAGFTDSLVSTVWMGNDDNTPMNGVTGGSNPASTWAQIMVYAQNHYDPQYSVQMPDAEEFKSFLDRFLSQSETGRGLVDMVVIEDGPRADSNKSTEAIYTPGNRRNVVNPHAPDHSDNRRYND